jgi:hypothetical protein
MVDNMEENCILYGENFHLNGRLAVKIVTSNMYGMAGLQW